MAVSINDGGATAHLEVKTKTKPKTKKNPWPNKPHTIKTDHTLNVKL